MSEPSLTLRRLHISGLTPSITPADLEHRLSSFGKVKVMDGFGTRDGLGDPRKFGFVTMEIGAKELAKCLNVLSGSTWKGAKLRIGEAKPDFRERLAQINSQPPQPARLKRMRARNYGHPSSTLPLTPLSPAAATSTPGWVTTPSGRVVRPMRMRPERPLEPIRSELGALNAKTVNGRVKKRVKLPPVRARRRLIDPTKWDSTYLKGVFLDAVSLPLPASKDVIQPHSLRKHDVVDEEHEEEMEEDGADSEAEPPPQLVQDRARAVLSPQQSHEVAVAIPSQIREATETSVVRDEANAALAMLGSVFGDKDDWYGKASVDGMEDVEDNEQGEKYMEVDEEDDIELVPRDVEDGEWRNVFKDKGKGREMSLGNVRFGSKDGVDLGVARGCDVETDSQTAEPVPRTNLKALFAPMEEASSFSLLGHLDLDLDLELDADILGIGAPSSISQKNIPSSEPISPTPHIVQASTATSTTKARARVAFDPSRPLLFPPPDLLPHPPPLSNPTTTTHHYGTPMCFLFPSATRVRGSHHFPPSIAFTRSPRDTPESIRERWEKDKSSLTREWKKAWREARGNRRGKTGAVGEIGGGY